MGVADAPTPRTELSATGWLSRARRAVVPKGLAILGGTSTTAGAALLVLLQAATPALLAACAIGYSLRSFIHLLLDYHRRPGKAGARLRLLTRANAVVAAGLDATAVLALTGSVTRLVIAVLAALLFLAVLVISGATVAVTRDAKIPRGTEWLRNTTFVRFVEEALDPHANLFGRPFLWVMRQATPMRDASCFVVCLLAALATIATADGATSVGPVRDLLGVRSAAADKPSTTARAPFHEPATGSGAAVLSVTSPQPSPASNPTYPEVCPGGVTPGYDAPQPQASALRSLWFGDDKVNGVGGLVGGCAEQATEEDDHPGVWLVAGMCHGALRSLGIATRDAPPQLMLQQVAHFAQERARVGELTGASPRIAVDAGDFQVVETTTGDYVLSRQTSSNGSLPPGRKSDSCADMADVNVPYVVAPPALVELWSRLVTPRVWVWPVAAVAVSDGPREFAFLTNTTDSRMVATATCTSDHACDLRLDGQVIHSAGADLAAADRLVQEASH